MTDLATDNIFESFNRTIRPVLESSEQEEPSMAVITVTPELAERWLEHHNTANRSIRRTSVNAYARDMRDGHWVLNGEAIKFDSEGTLLDGQHRLLAVVAAQVPVRFLVVHGVTPDAMVTIDSGMRRSFSDALMIEGGSKSNKTLAAVLRLIVLWEAEKYLFLSGGGYRVTHAEMHALLEDHPEIRFSAQLGTDRLRNVIPGSVIGLCHWLFFNIDPEAATWFIRRVADEDVDVDHPARVLRRRMIQMRIARGGRVEASAATALTIKAWNHFRAGEKPQKLQLPKGGLTTQNFPRPR